MEEIPASSHLTIDGSPMQRSDIVFISVEGRSLAGLYEGSDRL